MVGLMKRIGYVLLASSILYVNAQAADTKSKGINYSTVPFDTEAKQLEPGYAGHNIFDLMKKIVVPKEKGEYEKSEEYEARLTAWKNKPLIGKMRITDTFAFEVIEPFSPTTMKAQYDADRELMDVEVKFEGMYFEGDKLGWLEKVYTYKKLGTSNAITRGGIKFRVTSHTSASLGLAMDERLEKFSFSIPVARSDAPKIKPRLKIIAIVELLAPYKIVAIENSTASLDKPDEWHHEYLGLKTKLKEIWLVDAKSGEVLDKKNEFATCKYCN